MVREDFWGNDILPGVRSDGFDRNCLQTVRAFGKFFAGSSAYGKELFGAASCFEPDECLVQNRCSVTETAKSTAQDRINIAIRKKMQKNKKNTSTLLTSIL